MTEKDSGGGMTEKDIQELSFEEAMARLDVIVRSLESGKIALETSIDLYQEGSTLKRHCEEKLRQARLRIERIVGDPDAPDVGPADIG